VTVTSGADDHSADVDVDLPTVPNLPVVPAPHHGVGQWTSWPSQPGPVVEGVILSDLESEYVARHMQHQRAAADRTVAPHAAVEVRRPAPVAPRRPVAPVPREAASVVRRGTERATAYVLAHARRAATHERTRTAARWAARNGVLYVATGAWVLARRAWEAHTQSRYERMMRQAELAGDLQRLIDWEQRSERARALRHKRRIDWLTAPFALAKAVVAAVVTVAGMLLALGIALAVGNQDLSWVLAPLQAAVDLVTSLVWLATVVWLPLVLVAPWVAAAILWQIGRAHGSVPAWAAPTHAREQEGVIVTPGGIAIALAHLGIAKLSEAVKKGWEVEFLTPPVRVNNCGYHAVFSLPWGVTPTMIADRREVLARNLMRAPLEVWPSAAERAAYLDLWVADPGSTEKPAPPYPLLNDGQADVFEGIPLGVSQRGDVITVALPGANLVFGGLMGQGKSNAARVVILGAALDPLAQALVFVFANNGDFDAYRPRLAVPGHQVGGSRLMGGSPASALWRRRVL
jgi:DNA segregation ATPase FtsK/SpoIIIE, S-DNA-T family